MTPLVVITDSDLPGREEDAVLAGAGLQVRRAQCRTEAEVAAAGQGADALIVQWAPITRAVLEELDGCRFISRLGIGVDMIDLAAASELGIAVANTPDYCIEEVAIHTLALMLAGARSLSALDRAVRAGRWSAVGDAPSARRPSETTVAVIGFGRIGRRVAASCAAIGFRVVVSDPYVPSSTIEAAGHTAATLDDTIAGADIVTLHVPLTAETRHLLDAGTLGRLPDSAYVVNTCRGGLVDERALVAALADGHLGGAALDVFESEPLPADSPLREAPNLVLTPHAAWYSPAALAELPVHAARQVVDFLAGRPVPAIVNPDHARAAQSIRTPPLTS